MPEYELGCELDMRSGVRWTFRKELVTCQDCAAATFEYAEPVEVQDQTGRVIHAAGRVEKVAQNVNRAARAIGTVADAADGARRVLGELDGAGPLVRRKAAETISECGGALELALGILGGSDEKKRAIEAEIKKKFGLG